MLLFLTTNMAARDVTCKPAISDGSELWGTILLPWRLLAWKGIHKVSDASYQKVDAVFGIKHARVNIVEKKNAWSRLIKLIRLKHVMLIHFVLFWGIMNCNHIK